MNEFCILVACAACLSSAVGWLFYLSERNRRIRVELAACRNVEELGKMVVAINGLSAAVALMEDKLAEDEQNGEIGLN